MSNEVVEATYLKLSTDPMGRRDRNHRVWLTVRQAEELVKTCQSHGFFGFSWRDVCQPGKQSRNLAAVIRRALTSGPLGKSLDDPEARHRLTDLAIMLEKNLGVIFKRATVSVDTNLIPPVSLPDPTQPPIDNEEDYIYRPNKNPK